MSSFTSASEISVPKQHGPENWYACLAGQDGRVIRDFGDSEAPRKEPASSALLLDLMEPRHWMDFAASVQAHGAMIGFATRISQGPSAGSLLLHGFQTPCGLLILAIFTPDRAAGDPAPHAERDTAEEWMTRDELVRRANDAAANCAAMKKQQEDTTELLRDAIHQLKNPISSIIGSCEYLAEYAQDNLELEQRETLSAIEASAQTMLKLASGLARLCGRNEPPANDAMAEAPNLAAPDSVV